MRGVLWGLYACAWACVCSADEASTLHGVLVLTVADDTSLTEGDGLTQMWHLGQVLAGRYKRLGLHRDGAMVVTKGEHSKSCAEEKAMLAGFADGNTMPHPMQRTLHDRVLRKADQCPHYVVQLEELRSGMEYTRLEINSAELRENVAMCVGMDDSSMPRIKELHRVLARRAADRPCGNDTAVHLSALASVILEVHRIESAAASQVPVAGALLRHVNTFLRATAREEPGAAKYEQYFGDAASLTTFAELAGFNITRVPALGTSYVAEVYRSRGTMHVKWQALDLVKSNPLEPSTQLVHVKQCGAMDFVASMDRYLLMTEGKETSDEQWCGICGDREVAVCAPTAPSRASAVTGSPWIYLIFAGVGSFVSLCTFVLWHLFCKTPVHTKVDTVQLSSVVVAPPNPAPAGASPLKNARTAEPVAPPAPQPGRPSSRSDNRSTANPLALAGSVNASKSDTFGSLRGKSPRTIPGHCPHKVKGAELALFTPEPLAVSQRKESQPVTFVMRDTTRQ